MWKAVRLCTILLLMASAAGCILKNDLDFQLRFEKNPGLKASDPVIFEGNKVGYIRKVTYTEKGDYLMQVRVDSEFKNAATVDSSFYIERTTDQPDNYMLNIEQEKPGGQIIEEGALVQGSLKKSLLNRFIKDLATDLHLRLENLKKEFEKNSTKMQSGMERTINNISAQLQRFKTEVSNLPEREEVKQLGNALSQLHEDMVTTEKSLRAKIQTEIIPEIEKELEDLKQRLESSGREEEVEPLEDELKKIKRI